MKTKVTDWLPTRHSLLTRLKDWEDQQGWQDFFDTYSRLIYGTAVKAGLSAQEAQDVVQETVLSVSKKMPEFSYDPSKGSFKGWLMQLTRWRIKDQFRKRKPDQAYGKFDDDTRRTNVMERLPDNSPDAIDQIWEKEWE
ncbi:sigma-70 family RNA polymerase sigma factor, partial [Verrucomicrobia bacterium]|nr:sigma-70 family RNA polymerase sigma factor [Verrucomicrobiota bacterium]